MDVGCKGMHQVAEEQQGQGWEMLEGAVLGLGVDLWVLVQGTGVLGLGDVAGGTVCGAWSLALCPPKPGGWSGGQTCLWDDYNVGRL